MILRASEGWARACSPQPGESGRSEGAAELADKPWDGGGQEVDLSASGRPGSPGRSLSPARHREGRRPRSCAFPFSATEWHHCGRNVRFSWISGTTKSFPRKGAREPQLRIKAGLGASDMHWLTPEQLVMSTVCFENWGRVVRQALLLFQFINKGAEAP